MLKSLESIRKVVIAYFWKRYDMFWMEIDSKTEEALLEAEMENDEDRYNYIWFRQVLLEGDAWWHT